MISIASRELALDNRLDLAGQVLVIDEAGYWVKFVVHQVPATADKPHGLDYSLTLHDPDGERLVEFDNAHQVPGQAKGAANDHKHRLRTVRPYDYTDAAALLGTFWNKVESVMRDKGVWT